MDKLVQQIKLLDGSKQIAIVNISKNGVDGTRTVLDIDTIKSFGSIEGFSVPEGCTVSLKVFNDLEVAEKYIRGL